MQRCVFFVGIAVFSLHFLGYPTAEKTSNFQQRAVHNAVPHRHLLLHLGMPIRVVTQGSGDVLPHLRGQALQGLPGAEAPKRQALPGPGWEVGG